MTTDAQSLVVLAPMARVALTGVVLALGPLAWIWLRHRGATPNGRLHALTLLTLFLTFDLILFGAFTRLTDSGLGCPDWPGCYGNASPTGAQHEIRAAEASLPDGPVTRGKAWIEMIHRYLATGVGVLITVLTLASWAAHRRARTLGGTGDVSPWWATATLVWVCVQGAFGALTVTMKLYPAIVTAHLLGGIALLVLLAVQAQGYAPRAARAAARAAARRAGGAGVDRGAVGARRLGLRPTTRCSPARTSRPARARGGRRWTSATASRCKRELGQTGAGDWLPFEALTAIHYVHRLAAYAVLAALAGLAWRLHGCAAPIRPAVAGPRVLAAWRCCNC